MVEPPSVQKYLSKWRHLPRIRLTFLKKAVKQQSKINFALLKPNMRWRAMQHPSTPTKDTVRFLIQPIHWPHRYQQSTWIDQILTTWHPFKNTKTTNKFSFFSSKQPRYTSLKYPFSRQGTPVRSHFFEAHEHLKALSRVLWTLPVCWKTDRELVWNQPFVLVLWCAMWKFWGFSVWHIALHLFLHDLDLMHQSVPIIGGPRSNSIINIFVL